jgi:hypothetical protein
MSGESSEGKVAEEPKTNSEEKRVHVSDKKVSDILSKEDIEYFESKTKLTCEDIYQFITQCTNMEDIKKLYDDKITDIVIGIYGNEDTKSFEILYSLLLSNIFIKRPIDQPYVYVPNKIDPGILAKLNDLIIKPRLLPDIDIVHFIRIIKGKTLTFIQSICGSMDDNEENKDKYSDSIFDIIKDINKNKEKIQTLQTFKEQPYIKYYHMYLNTLGLPIISNRFVNFMGDLFQHIAILYSDYYDEIVDIIIQNLRLEGMPITKWTEEYRLAYISFYTTEMIVSKENNSIYEDRDKWHSLYHSNKEEFLKQCRYLTIIITMHNKIIYDILKFHMPTEIPDIKINFDTQFKLVTHQIKSGIKIKQSKVAGVSLMEYLQKVTLFILLVILYRITSNLSSDIYDIIGISDDAIKNSSENIFGSMFISFFDKAVIVFIYYSMVDFIKKRYEFIIDKNDNNEKYDDTPSKLWFSRNIQILLCLITTKTYFIRPEIFEAGLRNVYNENELVSNTSKGILNNLDSNKYYKDINDKGGKIKIIGLNLLSTLIGIVLSNMIIMSPFIFISILTLNRSEDLYWKTFIFAINMYIVATVFMYYFDSTQQQHPYIELILVFLQILLFSVLDRNIHILVGLSILAAFLILNPIKTITVKIIDKPCCKQTQKKTSGNQSDLRNVYTELP